MGEENLQKGLQEYLRTYAYSDATWDQLIQILDKRIDLDLKEWSKIWVKEAGMPSIKMNIEVIDKQIKNIHLAQSDPFEKGRIWPQQLSIKLFYEDAENNHVFKTDFNQSEMNLDQSIGLAEPKMISLNSQGSAYGYFELDSGSKAFLMENINALESPHERGIAWLSLWENMLNENLDKIQLFELQLNSLEFETDPLLIGRILSQTSNIYWQFFNQTDRDKWGIKTEHKLWNILNETEDIGLKKNYFNSYKNIALSEMALQNLYEIWKGTKKVKNLSLSDNDQTSLAYMLALKLSSKSREIINEQMDRINNLDRKAQIKFVAPALSAVDSERDAFFQSLRNPVNREHERWVVTSLNYLNHPLRADYSIKYLNESLELLQEIQLTGDIFFPALWLDAILGGYQSEEAAQIVHQFLKNHPDYPEHLKLKILQSSDFLFRSQQIVTK
jgi:aminopeptidase N